ncbi:MAG TPA: M56 family metallopeptidase [Candidatus Angelobacter sp.]|nr:M56 family metallopeptidase [Candidatus Angelobacter sp.]
MFYALAIALCLAVLFLALACISLLFFPAMLFVRRMAQTSSPENSAISLFIARVLPPVLAAIIALGLALPAFLEFEPHSTHEGIGLRLDALALTGALLVVVIITRSWRMLLATLYAQRSWRKNSERIYLEGINLPIYCVKNNSSLLAVTGIFRARIFLSRDIVEILSPEELRAALEHEIAHVSSFDNLKQMLLRITRPPRWLKAFHQADAEWSGMAEIAADQAALTRGASVLDLSSALIKVGRLNRISAATNAVASHLVPQTCNSSLEQRVMRLSALLQSSGQTTIHSQVRPGKLMLTILLGSAAYIACIHALLPAVHEALEFLVR